MKNWMTGIRGVILMIGLWTIGWGLGFGGIMELTDPDGKIQDVWPTLLAIPGFIGGIVFSVARTIAVPGRRFAEISLGRFAVWGGVTGLFLGLLSIPAEVGDMSPGALRMIGLGAGLGLVAGLGSGIFCRLVTKQRITA